MDKIEVDRVKYNAVKVYPMNDVKIDKGFYTVFELKRRYDVEQSRIILDSDFQRESVWNRKRKSELIESVLMGLPLPIFYFSQDKYGRLIVVDGRQRLTAFFEFMNDEYKLTKLDILPELSNKRFSELSPVMKGKIEDYQVQAHVIMPPTPDRIKFDIFDRVNRGGVRLNKQEIRNALYQGNATRLLNNIVASPAFERTTGGAFKRERRMKDKYFVNRFLAMYIYGQDVLKGDMDSVYQYKGDMDELLGKSLEYINQMNETEVSELEQKVIGILDMVYDSMGETAFRLPRTKQRMQGPINMNVFETVMYAFSFLTESNANTSRAACETLIDFLKSKDYQENILSYRDSESRYEWRMREAERIGKEF